MRNQPFSQLESGGEFSSEAVADSRKRLHIIQLGVICLLTLILLRVIYFQSTIRDRFLNAWDEWKVEEEVIPFRFGRILSRDGVILAQDETRYDVTLDYRWLEIPHDPAWLKRQVWSKLTPAERRDPELRKIAEQEVTFQRQELFRRLSSVSGVPQDQLEQEAHRIQTRIETMVESVEKRRQERSGPENVPLPEWAEKLPGLAQAIVRELTTPPDRFASDPIVLKEELQDHVLIRNVPLSVVAGIQSQPTQFPGVHVRSALSRHYPEGNLASHLIGARRSTEPDAAHANLKSQGESGAELQFETELAGEAGELKRWRNRRDEIMKTESIKQEQDGKDIVLTIDSRLQKIAESLLDEAIATKESASAYQTPQGASLIAMDLWTGEILTITSAPRPSLSVLARPTVDQWNELISDPRRPLFPRATQMAIPAGNLFQVVSAIAALESGAVSVDEPFLCRGYLHQPDRDRCEIFRLTGQGHGELTLSDALSQSCNVYFYETAERMGPEPLCDWASQLGFGQLTGIDLPQESPGNLPHPENSPRSWFPGSTRQLAVGQGALLVTPLQMVRMMAAIGNGGYLVTPQVALKTGADALQENKHHLKRIEGLKDSTIQAVHTGLVKGVQSPQGTAHHAQIDMMSYAAISGRAIAGGNQADHHWIAGYAPAESPRLAFVVVLEQGGESRIAAAIVRDLITEALGYGYLRPVTRNE